MDHGADSWFHQDHLDSLDEQQQPTTAEASLDLLDESSFQKFTEDTVGSGGDCVSPKRKQLVQSKVRFLKRQGTLTR